MEYDFTFYKQDMTFTNLTNLQAKQLYLLARDVALFGNINWNHPMLLAWFKEFYPTEMYKLLIASTVFPARAYESVIRHFSVHFFEIKNGEPSLPG